jgi:peptidyl-prolyl cis-trans isomerase C
MIRISTFTLLASLLAAQAPAPKPAPAVLAPPPKPGEAAKPNPETVIARLGKTVIRESDFDTFINTVFNEQQRKQITSNPGTRERLKASYLESVLMAAKARKEGTNKTAEFKKRMEFAEIRELAAVFGEKAKDELKKRMEVGDEDLKAYYDKNLEQFKTRPSFNARHILVSVKGGQPGAADKGLSDEDAKARIAKAQEALKVGKTWQEVAKEFSDDPGSKEKGGLYESVTYGRFVPEFDAAVQKQEVGKAGDPVKSKFGYHIIQVEKRMEAEQQPFEKVKEQVKQRVTMAKQEEVRKAYMEEIRKEVGFVDGPEAAKEPVKTTAKTTAKAPTGKKAK